MFPCSDAFVIKLDPAGNVKRPNRYIENGFTAGVRGRA